MAKAQKIAKSFHFGLDLGILGFSKTIHQFVKERDGFGIFLRSHHKSRLLLDFAGLNLHQVGRSRSLFLSREAPCLRKTKEDSRLLRVAHVERSRSRASWPGRESSYEVDELQLSEEKDTRKLKRNIFDIFSTRKRSNISESILKRIPVDSVVVFGAF